MKAGLCTTGTVWITGENSEEEQELKNFFCDNKTYSGEYYLNLATPNDQYADGTERVCISFRLAHEADEHKIKETP